MEGLHPVSKETGMKVSTSKHDVELECLIGLRAGLLWW